MKFDHEPKCWPEFYQPCSDGLKTFEVRNDDRSFSVGDTIRMRKWSELLGYPGRWFQCRITYLLRDTDWLKAGSCAFSFSLLPLWGLKRRRHFSFVKEYRAGGNLPDA